MRLDSFLLRNTKYILLWRNERSRNSTEICLKIAETNQSQSRWLVTRRVFFCSKYLLLITFDTLTLADDRTLDNPALGDCEVADWLGEVAVGALGALAPIPSAVTVRLFKIIISTVCFL